ncbi:hypothetical protein D5W64_12410 [Salmonella enterica subsp. enterica serovar Saintpaul]|nr:hypothetical protein [Salmonella enterica subsp. enterica serovar Saintpaul]
MNFFLKELVNRIINYLIRVSKGATREEKVEHLLRKSLLFTFMSLMFAATMTSKYFVANWYLDDLERSLTKVDTFMGEQQTNMNNLFRINGDQYKQITSLTEENAELHTDIQTLLHSNSLLEEENRMLKEQVNKK